MGVDAKVGCFKVFQGFGAINTWLWTLAGIALLAFVILVVNIMEPFMPS